MPHQEVSAEIVRTPEAGVRTIEYKGGEVDYSVIGSQTPEKNPIVVVNGFSRGRLALRNFAEGLSQSGEREVIISGQPRLHSKMAAIDHQAEALLAVMLDASLADRPVDFVAHSFGSLILWRAAEIAKQRGMDMTPFDSSEGSHSVFIAPSGSYTKENAARLGRRFRQHINEANRSGKRGLFPEIDKEARTELRNQPLKYLKEGLALGKVRLPYDKLGELGLRPMVFGYPKDVLFPDKIYEPLVPTHGDHILGYAMPADPEGTHDDPIFKPEPTVRSVLQILDSTHN